MIILSHRGYWKTESEKNSLIAFERSFQKGFGTETDIRDYNGNLVISHDIASESSIPLDVLLSLYKKFEPLTLALNIKSDGLQLKLKSILEEYKINNYFVFDMSVPDALGYLKYGLKTFTRQSEYEIIPSFYEDVEGVWLDEFKSHWINQEVISKHMEAKKNICIVSPELHKRDYKTEWKNYKEISSHLKTEKILLCTDCPEEAQLFFND